MGLKYSFIIISLLVNAAWASIPRYIDLSHDYSSDTLHWPTSQPFKITRLIFAEKESTGFYAAMRNFESNEHVGTHVDAPSHFAKGGRSITDLHIADLIGPAIVVDVVQKAKMNPDYQIGIQDFLEWEKAHGKIPEKTIVLLNTGYSQYWPNRALYSGSQKTGFESQMDLHFPGLAPAAATWLVQERKIKAIGIDVLSIDYGQTKTFETHRILTKADTPIFENVASMDQLPAKHFDIIALPMKIKDGTGAPVRIIAMLDKSNAPST